MAIKKSGKKKAAGAAKKTPAVKSAAGRKSVAKGKPSVGSKSASKGGPPGKGLTMKFRPRPHGNQNAKPRRPFGEPVSPVKANPNFVVIPPANKQPADLSYNLSGAVEPAVIQSIGASGKMVFHAVGDTGDINGTGLARDLAVQMEDQYNNAGNDLKPAFFYHLGDVVYYNGVSTDYRDQFYDTYKFYQPVIMAVPGNHDGQVLVKKGDPPDPEPSLKGFFMNFCDSKRNPSQSSPYRYTMNQPWPYWILNTPLATFIGLYSNVDGSLDSRTDNTHTQFSWLSQQLKNADKHKALILSVHHCPFSLDAEHGGYPDILDAIDQASAAAGGRYPDLVLSGHVHNYQRFQRIVQTKSYAHIVAGNGGYASVKTMHKLQVDPHTGTRIVATDAAPFKTTMAGVTLHSYNEDLPGFLRIKVDKQFITGEYFVNDMSGATQTAPAFDSFTFDFVNKQMR